VKHGRLSEHRVSPDNTGDYPDYLKVLFLRDPLRRLVSFYAHWVVTDELLWCFADRQQRFRLHDKSFRQFLYVLEHLWQHDLDFQHHLQSQTSHLSQVAFDRVILVEQLNQGLQSLNNELGISGEIPLKNARTYLNHVNRSAADHLPAWFRRHGVPAAQWFFDAELRDLAENMFAGDVALYRLSGGEILCDP